MKQGVRSICVAFSMYSRIPVPHIVWQDADFRYAFCFFPLIGIVIGALQVLSAAFLMQIHFSPSLQAVILVILPLVLSGGIHFDGFLDTSDALASWKTKEEKIRILKDSHCGAFAVLRAGIYFLAYYGATVQLLECRMILILCPVYCMARAGSAFLVTLIKNANPNGSAAKFGNSVKKNAMAAAFVCYGLFFLAFCMVLFLHHRTCIWYPFSALMIQLIYTAYFCAGIIPKFGGITGDLAGYFVTNSELYMVIGMAAISSLV